MDMRTTVAKTGSAGAASSRIVPEMARKSSRILHSLQDGHLRGVSSRVLALALIAADGANPHRGLARVEMKWNFWRWTADAIDEAGSIIRQDGVKHCCLHLVHTEEAGAAWERGNRRPVQGDDLRHEHAVPSDVLADRILQGPLTHDAVHAMMTTLCHAVVLTIIQDGLFAAHKRRDGKNLTSQMPDDWNGLDPWARYRGRRPASATSTADLLGLRAANSSTVRYASLSRLQARDKVAESSGSCAPNGQPSAEEPAIALRHVHVPWISTDEDDLRCLVQRVVVGGTRAEAPEGARRRPAGCSR
jgi:hypothetical protein